MIIQCVECRRCKTKCIPTAGTDCRRCTKNKKPCITAPPAREQRDAQYAHKARCPNEVDSDFEVTFASFPDELQSESESNSDGNSTDNIVEKLHPTKATNPTILVHRQRPTSALGKRLSEYTPSPSVNHSRHDSDQSDEMPLVKRRKVAAPNLVSTKTDLLRLMASQRVNTHDPQGPLGETSTSTRTTSTVNDESAASRGPQGRNPSTSRTLMVTLKIPSPCQINNTILQVRRSGSEGYRPLFLKDYMQAFQLFAKMIETWSLTLDQVSELHITFPWCPEGTNDRLMIWDRQHLQEGFTSICVNIKRAPCGTEEGGCCSIDVLIIPIPVDSNLPTTRDGRAVP